MTQDELKALVGQAALAHVVPGSVVGVGTGSTVNCFIDALASIKDNIRGAVSSSEKSSERLRAHGIAVFDANTIERIPVYIDGADEINHQGCMIKGGGAALTREKIVADGCIDAGTVLLRQIAGGCLQLGRPHVGSRRID